MTGTSVVPIGMQLNAPGRFFAANTPSLKERGDIPRRKGNGMIYVDVPNHAVQAEEIVLYRRESQRGGDIHDDRLFDQLAQSASKSNVGS